MMPTADQVGRAIVAACIETGYKPELALAVASGEQNPRGSTEDYSISRARAYAVVALYEVFDIKSQVAARLCGVKKHSQTSYIFYYQKQKPVWFERAILDRVKAAVNAAERKKPPVSAAADFDISLAEIMRERRKAPLGRNVTAEIFGEK